MDIFVARQPIFDRARRTHAYELLARAGGKDTYDSADPDQTSLRVLDAAFFLIGLPALTGGKPAFVNFTRHTLLSDYPNVLPPESFVIELLETVAPDPEVVEACQRLRAAGHRIALDDVVHGRCPPELLRIADIVKVDFPANTPRQRRLLVEELRPLGVRLLAEKIETHAEWQEAMAAGYDYFQGYFFAAPVVVTGKDVPVARLNALRLLQLIHHPAPDLAEIEDIIKREVSLTLKLLAYMNTAAFGFRRPVASVRQALMMLGQAGIRRWASVVALAETVADKPFELVVTSVVRARFCEELASAMTPALAAEDAFFTGLFSMIDALLGRPMPEVLSTLRLPAGVRDALLGADNGLGRLRDLAIAYERGAWDTVYVRAAALALDVAALPGVYVRALEWGNATSLAAAEA